MTISEYSEKKLFILSLLLFLVQGDNYASAAVVVEIARDFNMHISQAGLFVTAYLLPFGIFTLFFGPMADKYGKAKVISIGAFAVSIFCTLGGFALGLVSLSLIRAVNGIFAASIIPVTISLIGEKFSYDPKAMQNALGRALGMLFMGAAAAPIIAGTLTYLVFWRMVYFAYGLAIFTTAIFIRKTLDKSNIVNSNLSLKSVYREAFGNKRLINLVSAEFFLGFSVLGSFMYSGDFVQETTTFNIFWVGVALTFFGLGTVIGGRHAASIKEKVGPSIIIYAGVLGFLCWGLMGFIGIYYFMLVAFLGYGFSFILLHTFIVTTAQNLIPDKKGLVMSLVSFNLFVGGGLGTLVNSYVLSFSDFMFVFFLAGIFIFTAGVLTYKFIN
ncbi:MFS transporter [Natranaerofaba carboxydovora]|uniref:MFS transporter n=1 Tax=Natranaerofaba carboxydovora TaxID=2742683 RepID=UPI001F13E1C9|nr:MFS transporter [Natranaerofaba carboxydovora]UMZ75488.1 Major Facilitator Superfamily protein [Natranaerofaba carboxydovora]